MPVSLQDRLAIHFPFAHHFSILSTYVRGAGIDSPGSRVKVQIVMFFGDGVETGTASLDLFPIRVREWTRFRWPQLIGVPFQFNIMIFRELLQTGRD